MDGIEVGERASPIDNPHFPNRAKKARTSSSVA
jgi:hypothetical protein